MENDPLPLVYILHKFYIRVQKVIIKKIYMFKGFYFFKFGVMQFLSEIISLKHKLKLFRSSKCMFSSNLQNNQMI